MKIFIVGALMAVLAGCTLLNPLEPVSGISSHRKCSEPKDGYMDCTTTTIEKGVACIGSCAVKKP